LKRRTNDPGEGLTSSNGITDSLLKEKEKSSKRKGEEENLKGTHPKGGKLKEVENSLLKEPEEIWKSKRIGSGGEEHQSVALPFRSLRRGSAKQYPQTQGCL